VYEIELTVSACLRAGTSVDVAWAVETRGFSARDKSEALALTPGGGRVGSVLSGSLNDQLADLSARGVRSRIVDLHVGDLEAELAGLSCGGNARCLVIPAADLPFDLWKRLRDREPILLRARLDGDQVVETTVFDRDTVGDAGDDAAAMFRKGVSDAAVAGDVVTTVLWPVPKLVVVGGGAIADALVGTAELLGWHTQVVAQASAASGVIASLAVLDKVVVISHDDDVAGPALAAALGGQVGYIGAVGSRRTQQSRADWLAYRGVTELARIHGPAGLDIGANTPAEIAISIVAEAMAANAHTSGRSLREKSGSIH